MGPVRFRRKGFGNWHVTGNAGARIPNDMSKNTAQLHYSLQLDNYVNQYFIPFVAANAFTTLNGARVIGIPSILNTEGFDLINFDSGNAAGKTQATLGFGWEKALGEPGTIFDDRFTVDFVITF
jgi:hypothetical protein